jgi:hypothetical protein
MKTTTLKSIPTRKRSLMAMAAGVTLGAGLATAPLHAVEYDEDYGNIPAGYNEDEWYDPGDWFDGNNIERDGNDYDWWDNRGWSDSYTDTRDRSDSTTVSTVTPYHYYYWDPVVLTWSVADTDDQKMSQSDNSDPADKTASGQDSRSKRNATLEGKVDGFKKVSQRDKDGNASDSSFVRVRLKNGESQVISLGSRINLAALDLNQGDDIRVVGQTARIDNREVLVARKVEVDGETFRIRQKNRPDVGQPVSIQGTVKDFKRSSLGQDAEDDNLVLRMELKDGKECVVDLGEGTTMQDLNLEKGSTVHLQGRKTKIDGKSLIVARKIRVDGDMNRLREDSRNQDRSNNL